MTTLYHGQFCIPSSEKEWNAVFDTANSLGLRVAHRRSYGRYPCIVFNHNGLRDEDDQGRELDIPTNHLSVLDFLIGMIGMKEKNEKMPKVEFMGFAPDPPETKSFSDAIKEAIEPLRQELLSANGRITKLEAEPIDMRECENAKQDEDGSPIIDMKIIKKQLEKANRFSSLRSGDDYDMRFDPKASPKNIPFSVALEYLKAGREVRRAMWQPETLRVEPRGPGGVGGMCMVYGASMVQGDFTPASLADILATDWEVIQETKKP